MLVLGIHVRMQAKKHKRKNIRIPVLGMNLCIRIYIYIYVHTHKHAVSPWQCVIQLGPHMLQARDLLQRWLGVGCLTLPRRVQTVAT